MNKTYGYIHVSRQDQNEDRQRIAMQNAKIPRTHIYLDNQSGKAFNRPNYQKLLRKLCEGDILYVLSIDRLGETTRKYRTNGGSLAKRKRSTSL